MIRGLLQLLVCQLVGEFVAAATGLPVPGPVLGMVVLLVWLHLRRPRPSADGPGFESTDGAEAPAAVPDVVRAADALLRHLQLLFVPVGVGVIAYLPVVARSWEPILGGLVLPWLAALAVTAGVGVAALRLQRRPAPVSQGAP